MNADQRREIREITQYEIQKTEKEKQGKNKMTMAQISLHILSIGVSVMAFIVSLVFAIRTENRARFWSPLSLSVETEKISYPEPSVCVSITALTGTMKDVKLIQFYDGKVYRHLSLRFGEEDAEVRNNGTFLQFHLSEFSRRLFYEENGRKYSVFQAVITGQDESIEVIPFVFEYAEPEKGGLSQGDWDVRVYRTLDILEAMYEREYPIQFFDSVVLNDTIKLKRSLEELFGK